MTMRPRRPWGAAICETVAACVGSWEVQRRDVTWRAALYIARGAVHSAWRCWIADRSAMGRHRAHGAFAARWGATERMALSFVHAAYPLQLPVGRNALSDICSVQRRALFRHSAHGAVLHCHHSARRCDSHGSFLQFSLLRMFLHPLVVAFLPTI